MSTPVNIEIGVYPSDCWPDTPNLFLTVLAGLLSASLDQNFPGIYVGPTTPPPEFQDRIWFNTTNGQWYQFISGSWQTIPIARQFLSFLATAFYADDTGIANALKISFSPDPDPSAYAEGQVFWVKALNSITATATLQVGALAATAIKKMTATGASDLEVGDIIVGGVYVFVYDGTQFLLLNPTPRIGIKFIPQQQIQTFAAATAWGASTDVSALVPLSDRPLVKSLLLYINSLATTTGGAQDTVFLLQGRSSAGGNVYDLAPARAIGSGAGVVPTIGQFQIPPNYSAGVLSVDFQQLLSQTSGGVNTIATSIYMIGYML